jgi:hypothetical protein
LALETAVLAMMNPEMTKKISTPLARIVSAPSATPGPTISGRAETACPPTTDSAARPRKACTPRNICKTVLGTLIFADAI